MKKVLTGAQILVEALKKEGVDIIFGYPGGQAIPLFDALYLAPEIKIILTRHEQGAVHAAEGYAKSTGKTGVVLVTSGPGATNTVTGLADANFDSVPLVCICGQVPTFMIGNDAFQEADITGITNAVTKHNYLVHKIEELAEVVKNSFYLARSGRPGPILIDIPKDVSISTYEFNYDFEPNIRGYKPHLEGNINQIKKAVELINESKKPVIISGGGSIISNASMEIRELAEKCGIPVTNTLLGLGSVEYDAPYFLGMHGMHGTIGANKAIQESDLLIALGSRFDDRATGKLSTFAPKAKIIHIDIDSASISKNVKVDVPVVGDLKSILIKLLSLINKTERKEWMARIAEFKNLTHEIPRNMKRLTSIEVMEAINRNVPDDSIIATDVGQHQMWTALYYKFRHPRSFITSGGLGTMGYGFPAAIGAQLANNGKKVLCVSGDGSIQMNIQELATAVIEELPVIVIIMNNGYLGMVRQWQELFFEKRYSSTCLMKCKERNLDCDGNVENCMKYLPDFVKLAESYGAIGIRVKKIDELDAAIKKALESKDTPVFIDVMTEREENVWPMVPAGASLDDVLKGGMTA
jgi:acetolactate synthase I/II/III large subunit